MLSACFLPCPETSTTLVSNYAKRKKKKKGKESRQHPIKPPARKRERRLHGVTGGEMQYTGLGGLTLATDRPRGVGLSLALCLPETLRRSGSSGRAAPRSCHWLLAQASSAQELAGGWPVRGLPPTCSRRSGEEQCPLLLRGPAPGEGRAAFHRDCEVGEAADPCPRSASLPRARQALLPIPFVSSCAGPRREGFTKKIFPRYQPPFGLVGKNDGEMQCRAVDLHLLVTRQKAAARGERGFTAEPAVCGAPGGTDGAGRLPAHPHPHETPPAPKFCRNLRVWGTWPGEGRRCG